MEERQPPVAAGDNDQKGVYKFENLGKVKYVGPEKDGSTWRGLVGWEAEDPTAVGHLGEGGEGAADGHDEREEGEDEVVHNGGEAEEGGGEDGEGRVVERESEGEVGEDCEG